MAAEGESLPDADVGPRLAWPGLLPGMLAATLIGITGGFGSPQVWVLALSGGLSFFSLARREHAEPERDAPDRVATLLKGSCIVVLCAAAWDSRDARIDDLAPSVAVLGFVPIVAGLLLRRRAAAALGHHFTIKLLLRDDHCLVDSGPYRVLRHPNYAGLVLVMLGTTIVLESPLALAALLLVWLPVVLLRILEEESALKRHLGTSYEIYARRTWRLLPGIF